MKHIEIEKTDCCGCYVCETICPVGAISMEADALGFYYPHVCEERCIECGKCIKACQIGKVTLHGIEEQTYYAGQHIDKKVRLESSSGGIFYALADVITKDGGAVYGAAFNSDWKVCHRKAECMGEIKAQQGSKYIQSDNHGVYAEIEKKLREGKKVLYTGTPCQCQGLWHYVRTQGIEDRNLYLVDVVCHGAGSPEVWGKYVKWLEQSGDKIASVSFRDKEDGWNHFKTRIMSSKGEDISKGRYSFFEMYSSLLITRERCFSCDFTNYERGADLTLADFWNIGSLENDFDLESGVSQILVNTEKGRELLNKISSQVKLLQCQKQDCWQPHLEYPVEYPAGRHKFMEYYSGHNFEDVLKRYGHGTWLSRSKKTMVSLTKKLGLYVLAGKLFKIVSRKHS